MSELPDRIRKYYAQAALPDDVVWRIAGAGRQARRWQIAARAVVALAAAVALAMGLAAVHPAPKITVEAVDAAVHDFFRNPDARLDFASSDPAEVRRWLVDRGGPCDFHLPPGLEGKPTVGCQILGARQERFFVVCFVDPESRAPGPGARADGSAVVHLILARKEAVASLPPAGPRPNFTTREGWSSAAWTDGPLVYVLTTDAGPEPLRRALKV